MYEQPSTVFAVKVINKKHTKRHRLHSKAMLRELVAS